MGTWGARIYEDDTALDLRGDFLEYWQAGKEVSTIEDELLAEYSKDTNALLALCCVELETGTLTSRVKQHALQIIESGEGLEAWLEDQDSEDVGLRKRELTLLLGYLAKYDGNPVKRKSWVELQKENKNHLDHDLNVSNKLDDIDWHPAGTRNTLKANGAHIIVFYYWLMSREYLHEAVSKRFIVKDVHAPKVDELVRIIGKHFDWQIFAADVRVEMREFVEAYYQKRNVNFLDDFTSVIAKDREAYAFDITDKECMEMSVFIDERYRQFLEDPLSFHKQSFRVNLNQTTVIILSYSLVIGAFYLLTKLAAWIFPNFK